MLRKGHIMKKIISFIALSVISTMANAADMTPAQNRGRGAQSAQMRSAPRATAQNVSGVASSAAVNETGAAAVNVTPAVPVKVNVIDTPEYKAKKAACLNNNIGIGNTFVWASRFGDTTNYATMVEDVEKPENNTCFVKVTLKSNDDKIQIADAVANRYYEWNNDITCGGWIDEGKMRQTILDAKKTGRALTVASVAVASAGVGVGAMELFGNKLIGGKVEGQKSDDVLEDKNGYINLFATMLCDSDGRQKKKAKSIRDQQGMFDDLGYAAIKCKGVQSGTAEEKICKGTAAKEDFQGVGQLTEENLDVAGRIAKYLIDGDSICELKRSIEKIQKEGGCGSVDVTSVWEVGSDEWYCDDKYKLKKKWQPL